MAEESPKPEFLKYLSVHINGVEGDISTHVINNIDRLLTMDVRHPARALYLSQFNPSGIMRRGPADTCEEVEAHWLLLFSGVLGKARDILSLAFALCNCRQSSELLTAGRAPQPWTKLQLSHILAMMFLFPSYAESWGT